MYNVESIKQGCRHLLYTILAIMSAKGLHRHFLCEHLGSTDLFCGLSLSRNSVVKLTDRHDMTIAVCRGR